jgi:hypothetical protein
MRVSLVHAVEYVAKNCYGLNSLEGVRVDIWGDGMARGKLDITRLCFRILGTQHKQFNCQSRKETFCFAGFFGKDTAPNMAINLGSLDVVGEPGWLWKETEVLRLEKKVCSNFYFATYIFFYI